MKHILLCLAVMCTFLHGVSLGGITYFPPDAMWDTWIYQEGDEYHLFYMYGLMSKDIGRAVSKDLIHWKTLPKIKNTSQPGDWDEKGMRTTGWTVKVGNKYYMSYGTEGDDTGKPTSYLVSSDLMSWERFSGNPVLYPKEPYKVCRHWRDLASYFDQEEQQWHGYTFGFHEKTGRPCIAHFTSKDYISWDYHEPVFISEQYSRDNNGFIFLEAPSYFKMKDKHYIVFQSVRSKKDASSGRKDCCGTWYLIGDNRDGPYRVPGKPLLAGSGRGRYDHYAAHTMMYEGQRLLYHHTWGDVANLDRLDSHPGGVCLGTFKLVDQNDDGTLVLKYWDGLDKLEDKVLAEKDRLVADESREGYNRLNMVNVNAGDVMITCEIDMGTAKRAGLVFRNSVAVLLVPKSDTVSLEYLKFKNNYNANTILTLLRDDFQQDGIASGKKHIRVMTRAHMVDVYVDNQWIFSTEIINAPKNGNVGMLVSGGKATISNLRIVELKPREATQNMKN